MTADCLTVITPTLGDSASRLHVLLGELRRFTRTSFRQIVCDDGTASEDLQKQQWKVCRSHGVEWIQNPGPVWGVSWNLNHAFSMVDTEWVFLIEDGLRPGMGWLDVALDFIDKIGNREWCDHKVGMCGFASLQDWTLALAGVWPGKDVMQVFRGDCERFWEPWNDGYICWSRLLYGIMAACQGDTSAWQNDVREFLELTRGEMPQDLPLMEKAQRWMKWRLNDHWPQRRSAFCGWYPGAFGLVNMAAWRAVGKYRDGCSFFEGHLGTRMGMNGYLSLCVESPPFLHTPSLGFKASELGRKPRIHLDTATVFKEDFQGWDNMDAPNKLASAVVSLDTQAAINTELAKVQLAMVPGWEKYL